MNVDPVNPHADLREQVVQLTRARNKSADRRVLDALGYDRVESSSTFFQ